MRHVSILVTAVYLSDICTSIFLIASFDKMAVCNIMLVNFAEFVYVFMLHVYNHRVKLTVNSCS